MDPAVLLHCRMPRGGSWPQDNHPQCSPTSSTRVQTKTLAPHHAEQEQTLQYLQGLSAALSAPQKTQSGPPAGWQRPEGGCSQGIGITPAFLVPQCSNSKVVAQEPTRELLVRRPWLPASLRLWCPMPNLSSKPTDPGGSTPGI